MPFDDVATLDRPEPKVAAAIYCGREHTPDISPGQDGYCSGNCGHFADHDGSHNCDACGKNF